MVSIEDLVVPETGAGAPVQPEAVRTRHRLGAPRVVPWWIRTHRWVALVLGAVILLECVSGSVLLLKPELDKLAHPSRYHSSASADPLSASEAIDLVNREHPEAEATDAYGSNGVYQVGEYFVDPGAGTINGRDDGSGLYTHFINLMAQVHDCFFACEDYPAYLPLMTKPVPAPGLDYTVGQWLLGLSALALFFLAISGLIAWWPALKRWGTAFRVRLHKGSYARDLDLHRLIGVLALPLLLMWGYTGMSYVGWQWPTRVYDALTPSSTVVEEPVVVGTGPLISRAQAEVAALAAVPGGHTIGLRSYDPDTPGGSYLLNISVREDYTRKVLDFGPTRYVSVDSHGGGVTGATLPARNFPERFNGYLGFLHTGSPWPLWARLSFAVTSGLAVVPLAITGITVWLTKWRSRRNRRVRKRLTARTAE